MKQSVILYKEEGECMTIFFKIIALLLVVIGIRNLYKSLKFRFYSNYLLVGKIEIPFWFLKMGASLFIIFLGIYVIMI